MARDKDSRLQQLSTAVAAIVTAVPALIGGSRGSAAIGLARVGLQSMLENARTKKLDEMVCTVLADKRLLARFDKTVQVDEFRALFLRARDTAAKSEKEEKLLYIRNFLANAIMLPGSQEPDKERYVRLIDELSAREHEHFIWFVRMVVATAPPQTLEQYLAQPKVAGGALSTYACQYLGVPAGTHSAQVNGLLAELVVAFRHMHSVGVLDGLQRRDGEMSQFQTNGFTPRFLRFIIDPF